MVKKNNGKARPSRCALRSECQAKANQRFIRKMLAKDWEYLVITRIPETGEYKLSTA